MGALVVALVAVLGSSACSSTSDDAETVGSDAPDPGASAGDLVADFSYEVSYETDPELTGPTSCPLSEIRFTDTSTGRPTGWEWEFADGTTSAEPDPVVAVPSPGSPVTLTVTRGGESDTIEKPLTYSVC